MQNNPKLKLVAFKDPTLIQPSTSHDQNRFLLLGEVENMPGHCLLLRLKRGSFSIYPYFVHLDEIEVIPDDEV